MIKNFLIFSRKKVFLIFRERELSCPKIKKFQKATFQTRKLKYPLWKNVLYFGKWTFLVPTLKNCYQEWTFQARKLKKSTLKKKSQMFRKMEISSPKLKKLLYFRRELAKPEKQKFLIFLEKVLPYFGMIADQIVK